MTTLAPSTTVRTTDRHLSTTLDTTSFILDTVSGRYFSLDHVGALVWSLLEGGESRTIETLGTAVLSRYDVDPERCRRDLFALIEGLVGAGLVEVVDEQAG